jgi:hypothetical protein
MLLRTAVHRLLLRGLLLGRWRAAVIDGLRRRRALETGLRRNWIRLRLSLELLASYRRTRYGGTVHRSWTLGRKAGLGLEARLAVFVNCYAVDDQANNI